MSTIQNALLTKTNQSETVKHIETITQPIKESCLISKINKLSIIVNYTGQSVCFTLFHASDASNFLELTKVDHGYGQSAIIMGGL